MALLACKSSGSEFGGITVHRPHWIVIHLAALLSSAGEKHPDLAANQCRRHLEFDASIHVPWEALDTVRLYILLIAVHGRDASQSHPLTEDEALALARCTE